MSNDLSIYSLGEAPVYGRLNKQAATWLLVCLLIFMNLQTLSITGWVFEQEESGVVVKVYQLILLLSVPVVIYSFRALTKYIPNYIWHWVVWVVFSSIVGYWIHGFNKLLINYLLSFIAMFLGVLWGLSLPKEAIIKAIRYTLLAMLAAVYVKMVVFFDAILLFFNEPWRGHPYFPMFYGGGPNLEATWIAFFSVFFMSKNKKWLFYLVWGACMSVAFIYASRVAIVLNVVTAFLFYFSSYVRRWERQLLIVLGVVGVMYAAASVDWEAVGEKFVGLQRLLYIGKTEDKGMQGRFELWEAYPEALRLGWWSGVGAGNTVPVMEKMKEKAFPEDNVHNIYIQALGDFGAIGVILFLILAANLVKDYLFKNRNNLFLLSLILYLVAGLVQFRGGEPYFYLVLGLYIGTKYGQSNNQNYSAHPTLQ